MSKRTSNSHRSSSVCGIVTLACLATLGQRLSLAEVISSPLGNYQVGIDELGNIFDPAADVGFRRVVDGYDPIRPGTSREAYGVSAGAVIGVVDPNNSPGSVQNVILTGENFQPTSASKTTVLRVAGVDLLQVDQEFTWVAENVLQIFTQVSNLSPSVQSVLFSRNVDWDIAPSEELETITASPLVLPVIEGSFDGFEDPNPLVPFILSTGAGGGFFGPGDLGAGLRIDLGDLQPAGTPDEQSRRQFSFFYAIGGVGQSEAQLRVQLGFVGGTNRINSAAIGFVFGNALAPTTLISGAAAVPEPSGAALYAIGALAMLAYAFGSQAKQILGSLFMS